MKTVSIIIPLFNKKHTIRRAVLSVLAQTFVDFDLIVIDDGSHDEGLREIADLVDPRIRIFRQKNAGPGPARNNAVRKSCSTYVSFLDADDAWHPRYLERAIEAFSDNPQAAACAAAYDAGALRHVQTSPLLETFHQSGVVVLPGTSPAEYVKNAVDSAQTSCLTMRRDVFERYGGFFEEYKCLYGEDTYLIAQVVIGEPVYFSREVLVEFHVEDSDLGFALRGCHPIHPALEYPERLWANLPAEAQPALARLLALYRLRFTQRLASEGRLRELIQLRRRFPWPDRPSSAIRRSERRIELILVKSLLLRRLA
jgi:glycosyltransferase involved in cell wall biosynthesis